MKYASVLLAVGCLLSAVKAQWLETTIQLPSGSGPHALCYNPQNNKVYCANLDSDDVSVIDAEFVHAAPPLITTAGEPFS